MLFFPVLIFQVGFQSVSQFFFSVMINYLSAECVTLKLLVWPSAYLEWDENKEVRR